MRKAILTLILILSLSSLHAFSLGYGIGTSGTSGEVRSASFDVTLKADLTASRKVLVDGDFGFGYNESGAFGLNTASFSLWVHPFMFARHPFTFMFINELAYAPGLSVGVMLTRNADLYWKAALDLVHLYDSQYVYDFLTPFVYFDRNLGYAGWGVELFHMSVLL